MDSEYVKFMVYAFNEKSDQSSKVTWTGIGPTLEYAKEKLKDSYTIQITPYTQEEWAAKGN